MVMVMGWGIKIGGKVGCCKYVCNVGRWAVLCLCYGNYWKLKIILFFLKSKIFELVRNGGFIF